jgi:outer membrane receptor protein involved in Fe transport
MLSKARLGALYFLVFALQKGVAAETVWQGVPLHDYIQALSSQQIRIIYSSDLVRAEYLVQKEPTAKDPIAALGEVLEPYGLTLRERLSGTYLIVKRGLEPGAGTVSLRVIKAGESTGIDMARVFVGGDLSGHTDASGSLILSSLSPGTHNVAVSADGYLDSAGTDVTVSRYSPASVVITLNPALPPLPEIVVTSSLYNLKYEHAGSHTFLDRELTTKLPDIGDEAVRSIERLPGTANGGVSTRSHIRGGSANEVLFMLDGLRLYEPYHLKDFHSISTIVDQSAIAGIDFYSAGYQARYGDRMSGVIDISLREPVADRYTELSMSFFSTSALSLGRFGDRGQGDWLVSARRGNLDLIADIAEGDYGSPRYSDFLVHVGWRLSDRTHLSANSLISYDKVTISKTDTGEDADAQYRNTVLWLKADSDWSENLQSSTILSASKIDNARNGQTQLPDTIFGVLSESREFRIAELKQDWQYSISDKWMLSAGFDVRRLEADYKYESSLAIFPPFDQILDNQPLVVRSIDTSPSGEQYAVYFESRWRPAKRLFVDVGARWDQQTYTIADNDDQVSPRLNILYLLGKNTELRLGFGRFYQAQEINELQVGDGLTEFLPAQRAKHVVGTLSHRFASGMDLRLEVYRKTYKSLIPRYENVFNPLVLIPELQIDRVRIDADSAVADGAEIMISGESERKELLWWTSYTWSEVEDTIDNGKARRSWDQTHTLKAGLNWDWGKWSFSAAGIVHTGWPKTDLITQTITNPDGSEELIAFTTPRNSTRHEIFHSLDARVSRDFNVSKGTLTGFFEITNLYSRNNPCCTRISRQVDANGTEFIQENSGNWLPLVPSLGVIWRF